MTLEDEYKYLIGGYFGIREMDEYDLKVYVLEEIEKYIRDFIETNPIEGYDYKKRAEEISDTMPLKTKLQDSLLVLNRIDAPMELVFMVKRRLKEMENDYE